MGEAGIQLFIISGGGRGTIHVRIKGGPEER